MRLEDLKRKSVFLRYFEVICAHFICNFEHHFGELSLGIVPSEHESASSLEHLLIALTELLQRWVLVAPFCEGVMHAANVLARVQDAVCHL